MVGMSIYYLKNYETTKKYVKPIIERINDLDKKKTALMMAFHKRLGLDSPLKTISKDIGRYISKYIRLNMKCTMYYSKFCPHSKIAKHEWDIFASQMYDYNNNNTNYFNISVTSIDYNTIESKESHDIYAFPTFRFNIEGVDVNIEYDSINRTCNDFKHFINNMKKTLQTITKAPNESDKWFSGLYSLSPKLAFCNYILPYDDVLM